MFFLTSAFIFITFFVLFLFAVHNSCIRTSLETTQMSINKEMGEHIIVYLYNEILHNTKEWATDT